nr:MAG TPA: hypothetical protein [Caudoviricetes sp.]
MKGIPAIRCDCRDSLILQGNQQIFRLSNKSADFISERK